MKCSALFVSLLLLLASPGYSKDTYHHSGSHHYGSRHRANGVVRNKHGRIKRSAAAKHEFERAHPCPSTGKTSGRCPGYVVDHVKPLECGGADTAFNMQWQTKADAKAKDKTEGNCRL